MPDRYATPAKGSSDWDVPLNDNFSSLDIDVEHRGTTDPDTAGVSPVAGAKFLDTSTGEIYTADGTSWTLQWDLGAIGSGGDGGSVDPSTVEGIADTREHVGPFHSGGYHSTGDDTWGVHFTAAPDLQIVSTVIDFDATNSSTGAIEIYLYEAETTNSGDNNQPQSIVPSTMTESEALVDSVALTATDGPERVTLNFQIPTSPETGEFFLGSGPQATGETIYLRRIASWTGWDDYSDSYFDLLFGSRWNNPTNSDNSDYYYRLFDIEIGAAETSVTSPWSHDVDEIYMRPRDPAEQYDVSPRSLWIDTS